MKIITCTGYYNTGSSAVTDFFDEFDNVKSLGETEFRFLQDPDGVQSLETNIIDHPHRHNSSHAIKRFIKASKFENGNLFSKRYRRTFGDAYMQLTKEYVENITTLITYTHWRYDYIERGEIFYMLDALISTITNKIDRKYTTSLLNLMNEKGFYTNISRKKFYEATKNYTSALFEIAAENSEYIMVDQLVPPSDMMRYFNYVQDLYVITVERDPRDIFILSNQIKHHSVIPHDIKDFCQWFKITRGHRKTDAPIERNLLIYFEDLVYDYENTAKTLMDFVEISPSNHIHPLTKFVPEISRKNTKLWEKDFRFMNEIKYIEEELNEYLYHYEN